MTDTALRLVADSSTSGPDRKRLIASLVDGKEASVVPVLLGQLRKAESNDLKIEAFGAHGSSAILRSPKPSSRCIPGWIHPYVEWPRNACRAAARGQECYLSLWIRAAFNPSR